MRDNLILLLLVLGCLWSLRSPWIGAILWTIVSIGSPHMVFGYAAQGWPVSSTVGACTLVGLLVTRQRINPFTNGAVVATLALALWMTIGYPFALAPEYCYNLWDRSMKIFLMLFVSISLLNTREKLEVFIWANVACLGYFGVKGGVFGIMTGGHYQVLGVGGFLGGNNEMGLALIVMFPLLRYLQLQSPRRWLRRGLGGAMVLTAVAIIATQSRGALVGMVGMASFFWLKNKNKLGWGALIIFGLTVGLGAMPEEWWSKMSTINTYEQDASAQGRINSWWTAWNIATERVTGGGFILTLPWIFERYAPNPNMIFVAHSIYFQMLGEHGFIGLILFLSIGLLTWSNSSRMISLGKADPAKKWAADLGRMVQVSLVGYAVSGAFLSLAYYDLPFNIMAMSAMGLYFARRSPSTAPPMQEAPKSVVVRPDPQAANRGGQRLNR